MDLDELAPRAAFAAVDASVQPATESGRQERGLKARAYNAEVKAWA
jgi:hypothetical protein